ncbi:hypothetical protein AHAS_Ahas18G0231300 [Arachis hypogaea]
MDIGSYCFYMVCRGRVLNIYYSWGDCKNEVHGFKDAEFKGFCIFRVAQLWFAMADLPILSPLPLELLLAENLPPALPQQPLALST